MLLLFSVTLLDNAVEASQRIKDPYIEISATQREHTPFIIITMINSCTAIRSLQMGNLFLPNLTHRHMALVLRA